MNSLERFNLWKENCKDELTVAQLAQLEGNFEEIENAFYKDLEFGTAGIRGILGAGTNCLNIYTVARITKGIADYMNDLGLCSVSICRDCRNFSDEFTFVSARVFAEAGIEVIITDDIMPTPFLSYMVRNCKSDMGVMITASHNPSEYNGYKVYNRHGYQLTDDAAREIASYIDKINIFGLVQRELDYYIKNGKIKYLDKSVEASYIDDVYKMSQGTAQGLKVVYSPLNGTGYRLIPNILKRCGVSELKIVEEQAYPDGNFPTCKYPNPEKAEALKYGIELARKNDFDIVLASDPDADRIAVSVKHEGDYKLLTGNEIGVLLTDFIFCSLKENGKLKQNSILIKSIVSTPLAAEIAKSYGGECRDVLTGFKYIGEMITDLESAGEGERFIFGFEESYGYLCGTHVRDKDAVVAAMLISEMSAKYKKQGITLIDKLQALYEKFGTYEHKLISYAYPGASGSKQMTCLLSNFRKDLPHILAGSEVASLVDYQNDDTGLPKADVIKIDSKIGSRLIIRPSGTEPLIKFYITVSQKSDQNKQQIDAITSQINDFFKV